MSDLAQNGPTYPETGKTVIGPKWAILGVPATLKRGTKVGAPKMGVRAPSESVMPTGTKNEHIWWCHPDGSRYKNSGIQGVHQNPYPVSFGTRYTKIYLAFHEPLDLQQ